LLKKSSGDHPVAVQDSNVDSTSRGKSRQRRPEHMSSTTGGGELPRKAGKQGTRGTIGRRSWDSQQRCWTIASTSAEVRQQQVGGARARNRKWDRSTLTPAMERAALTRPCHRSLFSWVPRPRNLPPRAAKRGGVASETLCESKKLTALRFTQRYKVKDNAAYDSALPYKGSLQRIAPL
jgi:hypothetical protein